METILEVSDINDVQNAQPSTAVIPAGSPVDIEIRVSVWFLIAQGNTLYNVAMDQGWNTQLEQAGLKINSVTAKWNSTTIVFHCVAVSDVWVGGLVLDDDGHIVQAGGFGKALAFAILGCVTALGLGAVALKISADIRITQEKKIELTERLADLGYTGSEINSILKGISPTADFENSTPFKLSTAMIGGAAILAAVLIARK